MELYSPINICVSWVSGHTKNLRSFNFVSFHKLGPRHPPPNDQNVNFFVRPIYSETLICNVGICMRYISLSFFRLSGTHPTLAWKLGEKWKKSWSFHVNRDLWKHMSRVAHCWWVQKMGAFSFHSRPSIHFVINGPNAKYIRYERGIKMKNELSEIFLFEKKNTDRDRVVLR